MWLKFYFLLFLYFFIFGVNSNSDEEDSESDEIVLSCQIEGETCNAKRLECKSRKTLISKVSSVDKKTALLSNIKIFHAYNPKLHHIPKNLGSIFMNLHTLSITRSELGVLEFRDFRNMKKLKRLNLPENKIKKVPPCVFRYVDKIEFINLDGNMIKALVGETFMNLPGLLEFTADRNKIEILESDLFENNSKLKKVSFNRNRIHTVEINFLEMSLSIELIDLQYNPCISIIFKSGGDLLRDFQNKTSGSCKGPKEPIVDFNARDFPQPPDEREFG